MGNEESATVQFRLIAITVEKFIYSEPNDGPVAPEHVKLQFDWDANADPGEKRLGIRCGVYAVADSPDSSVIFLISVRYAFDFSTADVFAQDGEHTSIPTDIVIPLLGIAFSTTRGILFERLAGTSFKGMPLPVVDPVALYTVGKRSRIVPDESVKKPERKRKK